MNLSRIGSGNLLYQYIAAIVYINKDKEILRGAAPSAIPFISEGDIQSMIVRKPDSIFISGKVAFGIIQ